MVRSSPRLRFEPATSRLQIRHSTAQPLAQLPSPEFKQTAVNHEEEQGIKILCSISCPIREPRHPRDGIVKEQSNEQKLCSSIVHSGPQPRQTSIRRRVTDAHGVSDVNNDHSRKRVCLKEVVDYREQLGSVAPAAARVFSCCWEGPRLLAGTAVRPAGAAVWTPYCLEHHWVRVMPTASVVLPRSRGCATVSDFDRPVLSDMMLHTVHMHTHTYSCTRLHSIKPERAVCGECKYAPT